MGEWLKTKNFIGQMQRLPRILQSHPPQNQFIKKFDDNGTMEHARANLQTLILKPYCKSTMQLGTVLHINVVLFGHNTFRSRSCCFQSPQIIKGVCKSASSRVSLASVKDSRDSKRWLWVQAFYLCLILNIDTYRSFLKFLVRFIRGLNVYKSTVVKFKV